MDSPTLSSNRALWTPHRRSAVDWQPPPLATTIVAPHPDDEALMFGGLIQHQRQRGVDVHVIAVTDGEASHEHVDAREHATARRREQDLSLGRLGVDRSDVMRLHLPDGDLVRKVQAIQLAIENVGGGIVAAPWIHDHHSDHEACGRAALAAARRTGATVTAGLFWAWRHTHPRRLGHSLARLSIDDAMRNVKLAAIDEHCTQLVGESPIVTADDLTPTMWHHEYYVISPPVTDTHDATRAFP